MDSRFCLRSFTGSPRQYFLVEQIIVNTQDVDTHNEPSHHIIVVDASGSMYGDMDAMKSTIEKVLTLEEFANANQLVSLLSYSSSGDVRTHFKRIPVSEVMSPGSAHVEEIRMLHTRGMTCISQSLDVARALCVSGELTCISLHSDGYANDVSPAAERRAIDRIIADYAGMADVYVNTLAYRSYSDFNFLNSISNALSGKCIQARNIREVYDALHDTSALLAGRRTPAIVHQIGTADYQIFVSKADQRVNGTSGELRVTGLSADGDKVIYRYREVDEVTYNGSSLPECGNGAALTPVYAFARAQLSEGRLNTAKYALVSTRDQVLLDSHSRALTNSQIAAFSAGLEETLFQGTNRQYTTQYGIDTSITPVLNVLELLNEWSSSMHLNLKELGRNYRRRGVKKVAGTRNADGILDLPWVDTKPVDSEDFVRVGAVEINRTTATANLRTNKHIHLINRETKEEILTVAGVPVDNLQEFRNWTLVGDGEVLVDELVVRINDKRAFKAFEEVGILSGDYDPTTSYTIRLQDRPLVAFDQKFEKLDGVFDVLMDIKVLKSIFSSLTEGTSEKYSDDQVAELKKHYLTSALYLSLPSTTEYSDLKSALADGTVDTRVSYNIDLGSTKILNASKFKSANAYLQRRFEATTDLGTLKGADLKWVSWWNPSFQASIKKLTAATKLDEVDEKMMPIFEDFLMGTDTQIARILQMCIGLSPEDTNRIVNAVRRKGTKDEQVESFKFALRLCKEAEDEIYDTIVSPVSFYVGATGLIPDEFNAISYTYEALNNVYPNLKVGKDEKDGTFFKIGSDTLLTVYVSSEYFSTSKC